MNVKHISGFWLLGLLAMLLNGCVVLPAPSTLSIEDNLKTVTPLQEGDAIVFKGHNSPVPATVNFVLNPYLTMGCMSGYESNTEHQLGQYLLQRNPRPGWMTVRPASDFPKTSAHFEARTDSLPGRGLSSDTITINRLRYFLRVEETVATSIHVPLYVIPFGLAACGNRTRLVARLWELPSGKFLGTLTVTSRGEFLGLAYMAHLIFDPGTQKEASKTLAKIIAQKLVANAR